jgi:hypothetical protein
MCRRALVEVPATGLNAALRRVINANAAIHRPAEDGDTACHAPSARTGSGRVAALLNGYAALHLRHMAEHAVSRVDRTTVHERTASFNGLDAASPAALSGLR